MSHENWPKSWNFVISHEILPILPLNCSKFVCIFSTTKKLIIDVESLNFPTFSAKHPECEIDKSDGHGKLRNGHGKVMEKYFVESVGTIQNRCFVYNIFASDKSNFY